MTLRLADIGVAVDRGGLGPGVTALLYEIADRLEQLAAGGPADAIDVASLPLNPVDRERLREALGEGEVTAAFQADGVSQVRETGIAGGWWTENRDAGGQVIAELIEIALVPEILGVAADDVGRGAAVLRARAAGARSAVHEEAP